ncbi:protein-lysine N-methyltransferase SMYD4 isoform X2 [Petromyzon marinus]|uniref:SET and MYND domain-containing protein 4 isoform X2 n=1 Tax=Petromyzon marinus TaxID=7757 RepID=A0AAJ7TTU0_PETMA|nr:SET and MYND domain-containing protein 4 isoform X2 [Petromyzon marinus]
MASPPLLLPRVLSAALEARGSERVDEKGGSRERIDAGRDEREPGGRGSPGDESGERARDERERGDPQPSLSKLVRRCWSQWSEQDEALLRRTCAPLAAAKDPAGALRHRQEGNRFFQQKQNGRAAACYSRSICLATPGSEEQALAFANRSAALFHMQHHQACLDDIDRALANGYPARLTHKLLSRRADALAALEHARQNPGDNPTAAVAAMGNPDVSAAGGCGRDETLAENGGRAGERVSVELRWSERSGRHLVAARDLHPGETLLVEPAFASAVAPDADADRERALSPEERCCHHCLREAEPVLPVPCQRCSYARFCGEPCRDAAVRSRHHGSVECALASRGLLQGLGPFVQASLRTLLIAGPRGVVAAVSGDASGGDEEIARTCADFLRDAPSGAGSDAEKAGTPGVDKTPTVSAAASAVKIAGCGEDAVYRSDYRAVYHLVTHADTRDTAHILPLAWAAAAVCRHLHELGFSFLSGEPGGTAPSPESGRSGAGREDEGATGAGGHVVAPAELQGELLLVGTLLLRHLLQLWCNAYAVTTLSSGTAFPAPAAAVESSEHRRVAVALFPVASLLNHACRPNVSLAFRGAVLTVRAAAPILAGEQLLHCYGPQAERMEGAERRRLLRSEYRFECACAACAEEEERGGPHPHDAFLCESCGSFLKRGGESTPVDEMECSSVRCGRRFSRAPLLASHAELRALVARARSAFEEHGKPEVASKVLAECLRRGRSLLNPLHATLGEASDCLAQVLAAQGRWEDAARHLRSSLVSVEARFGPGSPETAYELFKLTQLLFNGRRAREALEVEERAAALLSLHFGEDHPPVQELRDMRRCLLAFLSRPSAS